MTPGEALHYIRDCARLGRVWVVPHAQKRMRQRGVSREDIEQALRTARECTRASEPERWKVTGPDLNGDDLVCVVTIETGVVVITVF